MGRYATLSAPKFKNTNKEKVLSLSNTNVLPFLKPHKINTEKVNTGQSLWLYEFEFILHFFKLSENNMAFQ